MWYNRNQHNCDEWRNFIRQGLTNTAGETYMFASRRWHTHMRETELKEEEKELKQREEALKNGRKN
jgi:hypothetical protein